MKRIWLLAGLLLALALSAVQMSVAHADTPGFSKEFAPDTIGPGSTTTLTFTIDNSLGGGRHRPRLHRYVADLTGRCDNRRPGKRLDDLCRRHRHRSRREWHDHL